MVRNTESFIAKSNLIHNFKYDYSKVEYTKSQEKVIIICPIHGDILQTPKSHMESNGCNTCYSPTKRLTTEIFISRAKKKHGNKYDYSKVNYIKGSEKVNILCKSHGIFKQVASHHLEGGGCRKCFYERIQNDFKKHPKAWGYTEWENKAKESSNFESFKLYIVKCWKDDEEFYKIGKTFRTIKKRFYGSKMAYNYSIISIVEGSAKEISKMETKLKKNNKNKRYKPSIKFPGWTECFTEINKL